jgi:hypothetical protein
MWNFILALIPRRNCSVSNHFYPELENAHSEKCHISSNVTITSLPCNCCWFPHIIRSLPLDND